MLKNLIFLFAFALIFFVGACEKEGPAERTGEEIDETVEEAGEAAEEAGKRE